MVSIERERDPEVLRQVAKLLDNENKRLHEKLRAAIEENLKLKNAEPSQLQLELLRLQELVNKQRHTIFGDSSERGATGSTSKGGNKPQRGHGHTEQPLLPVEQMVHELDTADRHCPSCGGELCEMQGQFEDSELVHVVERHFKVVTHKRKKYRCACNAHIQTAPGPNKLIPGGRYAVDFAIEVALQKYLEHMPLERQVKSMRRDGLVVTTQTLWDQLVALAKRLGTDDLMDRMLRYLLSKTVLGADETVWRLLDKKGKQAGSSKWYAWSVCGDDAVYYLISETRGSSTAAELLGGYHGTLVTDGYYVYQRLRDQPGTDFRLAFCWSHVRRAFLEAGPSYREARAIVALIDELFAVERLLPRGPPGNDGHAQLVKLRAERSQPILDAIRCWLDDLKGAVLPDSSIGEAVDYTHNLWSGLTTFVHDANVPLSNNATERALRGLVLGRKNHYGSKSQLGTEIAAFFYTLLESAKLADIDPRLYLRTAVDAAFAGASVPLPHELAKAAMATYVAA